MVTSPVTVADANRVPIPGFHITPLPGGYFIVLSNETWQCKMLPPESAQGQICTSAKAKLSFLATSSVCLSFSSVLKAVLILLNNKI